ncbi:MAG: YciI family protein [Thermomicrobiales bacterium]
MQYLISVIDDGQSQTDVNDPVVQAEMAAVDDFNDRLRADGHWVYANGLAGPETATVIDNRGDAPIVTDGPFVESKEYLAGFWIIEAADLDVALALATAGSKACNRKVEVRPLHGPEGEA